MVKLTNAEQIILDASIEDLSLEEREIRRKIKQKITQHNYRQKLRSANVKLFLKNQRDQKTTSRIKIENQLLENAKATKKDKTDIIDKQLAQLDKKAENIKNPEPKISQKAPQATTTKKKLPTWKKKVLESGAQKGTEEYKGIRGFSDEQLKKDLPEISIILKRVIGRKLNDVEIKLITKIYNAEDLTNTEIDTLFSESNLSLFRKANIQKTVDKLFADGLKANTIKTKLRPVQNIMSRIEDNQEYEDVFQMLASITSGVHIKYVETRDKNEVEEKDIDKARALSTWSLDKDKIKDQKELINDSGLDTEQKAIASLYYLMPPRRLEYATMRLSNETDMSILENSSENYLILKDNKPYQFVFGKFKTNEKGGLVKEKLLGTQIFLVNTNVKAYLQKLIKEKNLQVGDHLFKKTTEATFGLELQDINFKIFSIKSIGVMMIRQAAATYNQFGKRSNEVKKQFAKEMSHDNATNTQYAKILKDEDNLNRDEDEDEVYIKKQTKNPRSVQVKKGNKIPTTPTVIPKLVNLDLTYKPPSRERKKPDRLKAK